MSMPLVELSHVTMHFGRGRNLVRAVREVNFKIAPGEAVALVGESGSGKSTLARIIMRLLTPTSGTVRFDGTNVHALRGAELRQFRRRFQMVFQDPVGALNPRMRVGKAVEEPLAVHKVVGKKDLQSRTAELFEEVGLNPDLRRRFPSELSGGQKQRVGIARALALAPEFLVLDEPVSALDVSVQAHILNLLRDLRATRQLAYLFISHDLAVVKHVADRVAVMYGGRLVEVAPAEKLFGTPCHPYTRALLAAAPVPDPFVSVDTPATPEEVTERAAEQACVFRNHCILLAKNERCDTQPDLLSFGGQDHVVACHHVTSSAAAQ